MTAYHLTFAMISERTASLITYQSRAQQIAERLADSEAAEEGRREDEAREVGRQKREERRRTVAEAKETIKRQAHVKL